MGGGCVAELQGSVAYFRSLQSTSTTLRAPRPYMDSPRSSISMIFFVKILMHLVDESF
jgi:hypothetical protein